jgi:exodeoxyribonuclease VIII
MSDTQIVQLNLDTEVMIDLETTGIAAGCCILSIGATTLSGMDKCLVVISHESNLAAGLKDNPRTMDWWSKQSEEARAEVFNNPRALMLQDALQQLSDWFKTVGVTGLWGKGNDFDKPILEAAYVAVDLPIPYNYKIGRCYRTLEALYPDVTVDPAVAATLIKHRALDDAIYQAIQLVAILRSTGHVS